jgi:hypothetical protein
MRLGESGVSQFRREKSLRRDVGKPTKWLRIGLATGSWLLCIDHTYLTTDAQCQIILDDTKASQSFEYSEIISACAVG